MAFERGNDGDQYQPNHVHGFATPTPHSNQGIATLLLCIAVITVWLFWPGSGEETNEPNPSDNVNELAVEQLEIPPNPLSGSKSERLNRKTDPSFFDTGTPSVVAIQTPEQGQPGEAQAPNFDRANSPKDLNEHAVLLPISGWVLDQEGEPVSGLGVTAFSRRLAQDDSTNDPGGQSGETVTDSEGYFAFGDLPDGEYLLQTESTDNYESAGLTVRTGVSSIVLRVADESDTPVKVFGVVTSESGEPIAGARVAPTDENQTATTDDTGNYSLELGVDQRSRTRSMRFTKAGYRAEVLGVRQSDLRDQTEWRLDAELKKNDGVSVDGTVTDVNGTPVAGARIQLYSQSHGRSYTATSRQEGSFFIENVEMGDDYRLWVRPKAKLQDYVEEGFRVGKGGIFVPVVLEPLEESSLRGRMVNAFRDPVSQFTLWMWNSSAGANRNLAVTSDASGNFLVENIPAGEIVFASRGHPRFTIGGIRLEPEETTTTNLVLDWGREQMAGLLVNSVSGEPVAGAEVTLVWADEQQGVTSRSRRETIADGSGFFIFTELGPGPHTIIVTAPGFHSVRREAAPGEGIVIELRETSS